jgi:dimethylaniline monooxygenase (N-oxide forming)
MAMLSERDEAPLDVAVVGGGWAGLYALKYLTAAGLRSVLLEARPEIGGVWAFTEDDRYGGVMETTQMTSSRCVTEASDFPFPDDYPHFPNHDQIRTWLEAYCDQFGLRPHIRLEHECACVEKVGGLWRIECANGARFEARNLVVASGANRIQRDVREEPDLRGFEGPILGGALRRVPPELEGKRVLVYGGGETSADLAREFASRGCEVYYAIPNGQWFIFKTGYPETFKRRLGRLAKLLPEGVPADQLSSKWVRFFSPEALYVPFLSQLLRVTHGFNGHGIEAWKTNAPLNRSFLNKSSEVLNLVDDGRVIPKRHIARCEGSRVTFDDGSRTEVAAIVTCTGYRSDLPFLPGKAGDVRGWYKYVFDPDDPSLALVGFVRPVIGSIPGIAEIQSRLVAEVFRGAVALPPAAERRAAAAAHARRWNRTFRHTSLRLGGLVHMQPYCDDLAAMMGAKPDYLALLRRHGLRAWWRAIHAPYHAVRYWMNSPDGLERVFATYRKPMYRKPWLWKLVLIPLLPLGPLIGALSWLKMSWKERHDPATMATIHPASATPDRVGSSMP